jgi:hypothetical protein
LPNPIDRAAVLASVRGDDERAAVEAFIAAMVWGYGRVGYGPFRTARVLTENKDAAPILREAADRVRSDGGPEAFAWLAKNRLNWLGVAFATKYLFFCSAGSSATPALVLDRLVQAWLREHAGWRVRLDWHATDYREYVHTAIEWAFELGCAPADVEYLMFADAASLNPNGQWASPNSTGDSAVGGQSPGDARPDVMAVLDALDEAAEAFAALPATATPSDTADFERGLQLLRQIVLGHQRRHGRTGRTL